MSSSTNVPSNFGDESANVATRSVDQDNATDKPTATVVDLTNPSTFPTEFHKACDSVVDIVLGAEMESPDYWEKNDEKTLELLDHCIDINVRYSLRFGYLAKKNGDGQQTFEKLEWHTTSTGDDEQRIEDTYARLDKMHNRQLRQDRIKLFCDALEIPASAQLKVLKKKKKRQQPPSSQQFQFLAAAEAVAEAKESTAAKTPARTKENTANLKTPARTKTPATTGKLTEKQRTGMKLLDDHMKRSHDMQVKEKESSAERHREAAAEHTAKGKEADARAEKAKALAMAARNNKIAIEQKAKQDDQYFKFAMQLAQGEGEDEDVDEGEDALEQSPKELFPDDKPEDKASAAVAPPPKTPVAVPVNTPASAAVAPPPKTPVAVPVNTPARRAASELVSSPADKQSAESEPIMVAVEAAMSNLSLEEEPAKGASSARTLAAGANAAPKTLGASDANAAPKNTKNPSPGSDSIPAAAPLKQAAAPKQAAALLAPDLKGFPLLRLIDKLDEECQNCVCHAIYCGDKTILDANGKVQWHSEAGDVELLSMAEFQKKMLELDRKYKNVSSLIFDIAHHLQKKPYFALDILERRVLEFAAKAAKAADGANNEEPPPPFKDPVTGQEYGYLAVSVTVKTYAWLTLLTHGKEMGDFFRIDWPNVNHYDFLKAVWSCCGIADRLQAAQMEVESPVAADP